MCLTVSLETKKRIDLQLSEAQPRGTIAHNKVVRDREFSPALVCSGKEEVSGGGQRTDGK